MAEADYHVPELLLIFRVLVLLSLLLEQGLFEFAGHLALLIGVSKLFEELFLPMIKDAFLDYEV
jgi:hypothetical protein